MQLCYNKDVHGSRKDYSTEVQGQSCCSLLTPALIANPFDSGRSIAILSRHWHRLPVTSVAGSTLSPTCRTLQGQEGAKRMGASMPWDGWRGGSEGWVRCCAADHHEFDSLELPLLYTTRLRNMPLEAEETNQITSAVLHHDQSCKSSTFLPRPVLSFHFLALIVLSVLSRSILSFPALFFPFLSYTLSFFSCNVPSCPFLSFLVMSCSSIQSCPSHSCLFLSCSFPSFPNQFHLFSPALSFPILSCPI